MTYAEATDAIVPNNQYALGVGLLPYSIENLVTPEISGLDNAEAMRAVFDAGVRQLVSDTSVAGQNNPSPNAGYWIKNVPGLLAIPRRPSGLSYNVSLPAEWMARYGDTHGGVFSYEQIIAACSDTLMRHLLRGDYDPWMFHQPNVRDIGGGRSLLSDLMDATLDKYAARATFPVVSPTMNELARKVKERMALDASGVSATIEPGAKLTVRVTNAATIPITGLCTPTAERYGGRQISHLELAAGQSVTLSLTDCSQGGGGPAAGERGNRSSDHRRAPRGARFGRIGLQRLEWSDRRRCRHAGPGRPGARGRRHAPSPFSTVSAPTAPTCEHAPNSRLESRRPRL